MGQHCQPVGPLLLLQSQGGVHIGEQVGAEQTDAHQVGVFEPLQLVVQLSHAFAEAGGLHPDPFTGQQVADWLHHVLAVHDQHLAAAGAEPFASLQPQSLREQSLENQRHQR